MANKKKQIREIEPDHLSQQEKHRRHVTKPASDVLALAKQMEAERLASGEYKTVVFKDMAGRTASKLIKS